MTDQIFQNQDGVYARRTPQGMVPIQVFENQEGQKVYRDSSGAVVPLNDDPSTGENISGGLRTVLQGATLGFSDEALAGLRSMFGEGSFDENVQAEREALRRFAEAHPILAPALEIAGGFTTGGLGGARAVGAQGLRLGTRALRGAGVGAGVGGVAGAGAAEGGVVERLPAAAVGAATGATLGAAAPPVLAGAARASAPLRRLIPRGAERQATARLSEAIARDRGSIQQGQQRLAELGEEAMIVDAFGSNVARLGRAVASVPGAGRETARTALEARQRGQTGRVFEAIETGLGSGRASDVFEEVVERRSQNARRLYGPVYDAEVPASDKLRELLNRPSMTQALERARVIAAEEGRELSDELPDMQAWDYMKRALDDVISPNIDPRTGRITGGFGNAADKTRKELLAELDRLVPDYRRARSEFAGETAYLNAIDTGRRFLASQQRVPLGVIRRMGDAEKEAFRLGVQDQLRFMAGRTGDAADTVKRVFGNPNIRERLEAAWPSKQAFRTFEQVMEREAKFNENFALGTTGSRTAELAEDISDLGSAAGAVVRGDVPGLALRAAGAAQRAATAPAESVAESLAPRMFSPGVQRNQNVLEELARRGRLPPAGAVQGAVAGTLATQADRPTLQLPLNLTVGAF